MKFEFYVMNENRYGKREIEPYNIFNNCVVQERCEKAVKKYLRAPSKYKYIKHYANPYMGTEEVAFYGFEGFCEEIKMIIACEEHFRCEYEICVGSLFTTEISDVLRDIDKFTTYEELKSELERINKRNGKLYKIDCYMQCENNIKMIAHEIIRQYKEKLKEEKDAI